ncbi:inverse autotransporter beta domain-containing protein [Salmonella enterica]|nr:inverse autotransporter beta domain-containing protein [Salmonella enterica]EME7695725.1 inverse autotransporter beta domain-containing protein [Salmonella enterica]
MASERNPLKKYLTWALITSQISTPALATGHLISSQDENSDTWLSQTASTIAPHLQEGTLKEFAKGKVNAIPERAINKGVSEGAKKLIPDISIRGGISLEDGTRYRSAEFDMFIPVRETTSSILFGQLGFRDHDNSRFDGRQFVNSGLGFRHETGDWVLGANAFLDSDIKNSHVRGSVGAEAMRDTLSFSGNYYFPLTGWKSSGAHEFHDERPAYGFDLRAKGTLPELPWYSAELTYEQYYGDKVDILGNRSLSKNPSAAGAALLWRPVPLIELRAGYRDAGSGGSQTEGGIKLNYVFGTPLKEQLDYRNVSSPTNSRNFREFVDRNYNIVMEYREQASSIKILTSPISGVSGEITHLTASVNSRYPIQKIEWSGDPELIAGLQQQGNINSGLQLPQLPLDATEGREYSLYLTVTDSQGTRVTSERIPVTVTQDYSSFKSWLNIINDDVSVTDGNFIINSPVPTGEEGMIIEWHYVRERSKDEWNSLKPGKIEYQTETSGLVLKSLGGVEKNGHWVERVHVTYSGKDGQPLVFSINAVGPDGKHPVKGTVKLKNTSEDFTQNISSVRVIYTPGNNEQNGSDLAPVVGTVIRAETLCTDNVDCTERYNYQWEISADNKIWHGIPGATQSTWKIPYEMNGNSFQNRFIRVKIVSEKQGIR